MTVISASHKTASIRVDFPMPASPRTSTAPPFPLAAEATSDASALASRSRPIRFSPSRYLMVRLRTRHPPTSQRGTISHVTGLRRGHFGYDALARGADRLGVRHIILLPFDV